MFKEKGKGDNMPVIIERIIKNERADKDAFIKKQNERLLQLKKIEQRKQEGKVIRQKKIVLELQCAGILDEHGNLAAPYRTEE